MEGAWALALDGQDSNPGVSLTTGNRGQMASPHRVPVSQAIKSTQQYIPHRVVLGSDDVSSVPSRDWGSPRVSFPFSLFL